MTIPIGDSLSPINQLSVAQRERAACHKKPLNSPDVTQNSYLFPSTDANQEKGCVLHTGTHHPKRALMHARESIFLAHRLRPRHARRGLRDSVIDPYQMAHEGTRAKQPSHRLDPHGRAPVSARRDDVSSLVSSRPVPDATRTRPVRCTACAKSERETGPGREGSFARLAPFGIFFFLAYGRGGCCCVVV
jgi:hypothetical protein